MPSYAFSMLEPTTRNKVMKLIRRGLSTNVGAWCIVILSIVAGVGPNSAFAAAPQVKTQGPGFYRMMVGQFEVTALLDGTHPFPIDTVIEGVPKAEVERDLARDFLQAPVQGSINAFLINTGSKLILIDTGAGVLYGDCCGRLLANLRAAGYQPGQIDEVLLTHLHKDHVGGIVANGAMVFPNAVVRTSRTEADYWLNPANKTKGPLFSAHFSMRQSHPSPPMWRPAASSPSAGTSNSIPGFGPLRFPAIRRAIRHIS
ncbi:hypothetical protein OKW29_005923 [Paraburkholderia sp. CI3]